MNQDAGERALVPPPWTLSGSAYALIYRFSENYVYERVPLPDALSGTFVGGLGALILVDYTTSPVDSYRELVFTPGQFALGGEKGHTVTHIYVSTAASQQNGRAHWGLPKELADFSIYTRNGVDHWRVSTGGQVLLEARFRPGRLTVPLPGWLVRPHLLQTWENSLFHTRFRISGQLQLSDAEAPQTSGAFPDIGAARPIGVVHLPRFRMTFPAAQRRAFDDSDA